jgi:hypothetical protein
MNAHPLVNALRQAIKDRSFVDSDGDVHYCPYLTVDEIELVIAKWERDDYPEPAANSERSPCWDCACMKEHFPGCQQNCGISRPPRFSR